MAEIEIYTTRVCYYCNAAKSLLEELDLSYDEVDVTGDREKRAALRERAGGRRTVPQIFINGESIGGYTELRALHLSRKLDAMLEA